MYFRVCNPAGGVISGGWGWGWGLRTFREGRYCMTMDNTNLYSLNCLSTDPKFDFISTMNNINSDEAEYVSSPYEDNSFSCFYVDPAEYTTMYRNCKNVSIMSFNIQSIAAKFSEFTEFIDVLYKADCSPDVICLQELWRFPVYANFVLPGYSRLEYKLRGNNVQGGGVGIFVKSNLKFCVLSAQSIFVDRIFESIFIKLELPNSRKCIIGSVYRPGTNHPTLSASDLYENFSELLSNVLDEISSFNLPIYILGDINLDVLNYESCKQVSDYVNQLFFYGLLQVVTKPTRCTMNSATLIDHVITNVSHSTFETAIITSKISDHFPVVFFLQPKKPCNKPKTIISRDFSQQNLEKFNAALHNIRWGFVLEEDDPQLSYICFLIPFLIFTTCIFL